MVALLGILLNPNGSHPLTWIYRSDGRNINAAIFSSREWPETFQLFMEICASNQLQCRLCGIKHQAIVISPQEAVALSCLHSVLNGDTSKFILRQTESLYLNRTSDLYLTSRTMDNKEAKQRDDKEYYTPVDRVLEQVLADINSRGQCAIPIGRH